MGLSRRIPRTERRTQRVLALLIIPMLLAGLAAFAWFDNALHRGITYQVPETSQPIAHTDQARLGVNAFNIQYEPDRAVVQRTLDMAAAMGARYVRMQLPWEDVEIHARGDFEDRRNPGAVRNAWEKYDQLFADLQARGLEPVVRIDRPPRWARATADATPAFQAGLAENGNSTGPPDNYADYANFVGQVAARYRGSVRYIQIWNEPNLAYEWNWVLPEPERFAELLKQAAIAARQANPEVVILFPSLSPTDGLEPRIAPLSELEYLDRVYKAGAAEYFDIMSAQAYGLGQPPDEHRYVRPRTLWQRPIDTRIDVSRIVLLREVMEHNGDTGTAVWISEFGYVDAPADLPHTWGDTVSAEQKAQYLVGQVERARREWPWVGVMHVWFLRWGGPEPDPRDPTAYFALVGRDFSPSPAYSALQAMAAKGEVAGVGQHAWSHPAVQQRSPNEWQIRFTGQSLAFVGLPGIAMVALDGAAASEYRPGVQRTSIATGLADGEHTAVITSPNGPPTSFVVERQPPPAWLWNSIPLVLIALLALAIFRVL